MRLWDSWEDVSLSIVVLLTFNWHKSTSKALIKILLLPGIEPDSMVWETSTLTSSPPGPPFFKDFSDCGSRLTRCQAHPSSEDSSDFGAGPARSQAKETKMREPEKKKSNASDSFPQLFCLYSFIKLTSLNNCQITFICWHEFMNGNKQTGKISLTEEILRRSAVNPSIINPRTK